MIRLLDALRRERNGDAAASMRYYGVRYGLSYGVSLPAVRALARAEGTDPAFAGYLFAQDVRELKIAALWIADPGALDAAGAERWAAGLVNSELAAEAALALLSRVDDFGPLFAAWTAAERPWPVQYAALLGAARNAGRRTAWLDAAADVVRRNPENGLLADAAVAFLAAVAECPQGRDAVVRTVAALGDSAAAEHVREELAWRLAE